MYTFKTKPRKLRTFFNWHDDKPRVSAAYLAAELHLLGYPGAQLLTKRERKEDAHHHTYYHIEVELWGTAPESAVKEAEERFISRERKGALHLPTRAAAWGLKEWYEGKFDWAAANFAILYVLTGEEGWREYYEAAQLARRYHFHGTREREIERDAARRPIEEEAARAGPNMYSSTWEDYHTLHEEVLLFGTGTVTRKRYRAIDFWQTIYQRGMQCLENKRYPRDATREQIEKETTTAKHRLHELQKPLHTPLCPVDPPARFAVGDTVFITDTEAHPDAEEYLGVPLTIKGVSELGAAPLYTLSEGLAIYECDLTAET